MAASSLHCYYGYYFGGDAESGRYLAHFGGILTAMRRSRYCLVLVLLALLTVPQFGAAKTLEELRGELRGKKDNLKEVQDKIEAFKVEIQDKKREARTLEDQIILIDESIEEINLSIERTVVEIETTSLEIDAVKEEVKEKEFEIQEQKDLLGEYIRALHSLDRQSTVSVLLKCTTFSEVVSESATFTELHDRAQQTLTVIQALKNELEQKKRDLEDFKETLEALRRRQEGEQQILESQRGSKERLLDLTQEQEKQFNSLLQQSQAAHQAAQSEIKRIDELIREEIRKQGIDELPSVGTFDYPIDVRFGTSCEFHCGGYPYEYLIGPHSGIDWPASPGSVIKAPADGYVARTHNANGPGYSYILLIHGDGLSTVYGHVSGFGVNEGDVVTRGSVIGYTGGSPGSNGAGLSSGPHLHWEVRKDSVPVNPRSYL